MFVGVEQVKGAEIGQVLGLPANIKLGWKGLSWTHTSLKQTLIHFSRRKFDNLGPRVNPNL